MSPEAWFSLANVSVLPAWAMLIFAPRWRGTDILVHRLTLPLVLAVLYIYLLASSWGQLEGGFGSLREVSLLFSNPKALLAGWVHYLAFDLFVGAWETRDAAAHGLPRWLVAPCLILTFMLGPAGLALYVAVRAAFARGNR
jgi:hypothetical protein